MHAWSFKEKEEDEREGNSRSGGGREFGNRFLIRKETGDTFETGHLYACG